MKQGFNPDALHEIAKEHFKEKQKLRLTLHRLAMHNIVDINIEPRFTQAYVHGGQYEVKTVCMTCGITLKVTQYKRILASEGI